MRLAAELKAGYYPAPPEAIEGILKHLKMPEKYPERVTMLDPCCGEGAALKQLAEGLGITPNRVYAIELDSMRANLARLALPQATIVGPSNYLNTRVTGFSFGIVYVNPPFADQFGGGKREEHSFIEESIRKLARGGTLVAVLPVRTLLNYDFLDHLDLKLFNIQVYSFPKDHRQYKEVVIFGVRRPDDMTVGGLDRFGEMRKRQWNYMGSYSSDKLLEALPELGQIQPKTWSEYVPSYDRFDGLHVWEPIWCNPPHTFRKEQYTDEELDEALKNSPLIAKFSEVKAIERARPPLSLGRGHVALLLASGWLDGLVEAMDGNHVVRGCVSKVSYISSRIITVNEEAGKVQAKQTTSQKIILTIRVVDRNGIIYTFADEAPVDFDDTDEDTGQDEDEEVAA